MVLLTVATAVAVAAVTAAVTAATVGAGYSAAEGIKGTVNRAKRAVEDVSSDLKKFYTEKIWPSILPCFRVLPTYLLILVISHCDAFLKNGSLATVLLAYSVYYISWMCALYFVLKLLLDDILRRKVDCGIFAVVFSLGVILPLWEVLDGYFQIYDSLKEFVNVLIDHLATWPERKSHSSQ